MNIDLEEYKHLCNQKIIDMLFFYDKCKCQRCQERVKLMDEILKQRDFSKNAEG